MNSPDKRKTDRIIKRFGFYVDTNLEGDIYEDNIMFEGIKICSRLQLNNCKNDRDITYFIFQAGQKYEQKRLKSLLGL